MTQSRRGLGIAVLLFGGWYLWSALQLEPLAGEAFGPGMFPTVLGVLMLICGALLVVLGNDASGMLARRFTPAAFGRLAVLFGGSLLYIYGAPTIGFLLAGFLVVTAFALALGVRWMLAVPFGIVAAVAFNLVFETLLRVPLPPGEFGVSF